MDAIREIFETCPYNHYEGPEQAEKLIIASGTGRLYCHEALKRLGVSDSVGLLSLATLWPLPKKYILS